MGKTIDTTIIRVDGSEEKVSIPRAGYWHALDEMLGVMYFATVDLKDGRIMLVDDTGLFDGKAVNPRATALYHAVCRPGTTDPIVGDVAIVWDRDFD